jgi:hypothetical protein
MFHVCDTSSPPVSDCAVHVILLKLNPRVSWRRSSRGGVNRYRCHENSPCHIVPHAINGRDVAGLVGRSEGRETGGRVLDVLSRYGGAQVSNRLGSHAGYERQRGNGGASRP